MAKQPPSPLPPPPPTPTLSMTEAVDVTLHAVGFELELLSPTKVSGRLQVSDKNCQPFKFLHGGVSALISESLASIGAHFASGYNRVAGVQLSINHVKNATIGDVVLAEATPVNIGNTIQVWEVRLCKIDPKKLESKSLVSFCTVTLLCNRTLSDQDKRPSDIMRKLAKL